MGATSGRARMAGKEEGKNRGRPGVQLRKRKQSREGLGGRENFDLKKIEQLTGYLERILLAFFFRAMIMELVGGARKSVCFRCVIKSRRPGGLILLYRIFIFRNEIRL